MKGKLIMILKRNPELKQVLLWCFIIWALSIFLVVTFHEGIHYFAIKLLGYTPGDYKFGILHQSVRCLDCENIHFWKTVLIFLSPYFFDLVPLSLYNFYRKSKTLALISFLTFIDIIGNFIMFFIFVITNSQNTHDFSYFLGLPYGKPILGGLLYSALILFMIPFYFKDSEYINTWHKFKKCWSFSFHPKP